jgi:sulfatase maturation enzyme AslB (radical SAM superfamily)
VISGIDFAKWQEIILNRGNKTLECQECQYKNRCSNSCGCTNYYLSGDIAQVGPALCFFEKLTIDASDFIATILFKEQNSAFIDRFYS